MKQCVLSLLVMLFWVSGMDDTFVPDANTYSNASLPSTPDVTIVCAYCSAPLHREGEPLIRLGCVQGHLFHKGCMKKYMPDYIKRHRYGKPSESATSLDVSSLANARIVCPSTECPPCHVDKHAVYELDGEKETQLFPSYKGVKGKMRQAADFLKDFADDDSD